MYFLCDNEHNKVKIPQSAQRKHSFLVKMKEKSKLQKQIPKKKFSLGLFNQRLGHRSTRSLLARDTVNVWKDIEIRVDTDPFCTACQISIINKNSISNTHLKSKTPFK